MLLFRRAIASLIVLTGLAGCATGPRGILIMAHGGDRLWNEAVEETVRPLHSRYPTEIAFGMADTKTLREAVRKLEARGVGEIAVVRMFISGESFLPETEYILGLRQDLPRAVAASHYGTGHGGHGGHGSHGGDAMSPPEPIEPRAALRLSRRGVAASPLVDEILIDRVRAMSVDPSHESVLILAHGPASDAENARWLAHMERRVQAVRRIGPFREVRCETLREDWPEKRSEAEQRIRKFVHDQSADAGRVIVVPFRVAGFGPYAGVLEGLTYVSDGRGFCPHPNMTRWIEQTAEECFDLREATGTR